MSYKAQLCTNCRHWRDIHENRPRSGGLTEASVGHCEERHWPGTVSEVAPSRSVLTFYDFGCNDFEVYPDTLAEKLTDAVMESLGWSRLVEVSPGYESTRKLVLKGIAAVLDKEKP